MEAFKKPNDLLLQIKCRSLGREVLLHLPMRVVTTTVQKKICTGAGLAFKKCQLLSS
jgi:hypothetical protein